MKVAVISGVTGQDGAYLAAFLLAKNYRVIGLLPHDRASDTFRLEFLNINSKVIFRSVNLLNDADVRKLFLEESPDEFYNLAAISSVGLSFSQPLITFDFNTRSVLNILDAIRMVSNKTRFYQASSSEMFGNVGKASLPIQESFLFHPVSPYGISKASAHWLTINYREAFGLKSCCGILFNHESALRPPNFAIKKIIQSAIEIKKIKAGRLTLGNLSISRDWGYAPKYVEAMWRMLQQERLNDYIICSGTCTSLRNFVTEVFAQLNLDAEEYITIDKSLFRSLELDTIFGDNLPAKKELDWDYEMSNKELIKQLIADEYELMTWRSSLNLP